MMHGTDPTGNDDCICVAWEMCKPDQLSLEAVLYYAEEDPLKTVSSTELEDAILLPSIADCADEGLNHVRRDCLYLISTNIRGAQ